MRYKTTFLALALSLSACSEEADTSSESKGKHYANAVKHAIHAEYLACYPLSKNDKKQCVNNLADDYLKNKRQDKSCVQAFQYEAEKLGFRNFLKQQGLPCERVDYGAEFDPEKEAYLVKCTSSEQYYMQFDYKEKQWNLLDEER